MSVLLLVRHGQASFGKRNYDELSELGHEQSRVLGRALAERGVIPDVVLHGDLRRHEQTVAGLVEGLGEVPEVAVDDGWDEFDFMNVVQVHKPSWRNRTVMRASLAATLRPRRAFQEAFEEATHRWTAGEHDDEYEESWDAFTSRVTGALDRAVGRDGTVLVVSSGGPISLVSAMLLDGGPPLWGRLNRVTVNTGVTKVIAGSSGVNLATFNAHAHLEHDRSLITYR